jgi:hypothetical protein
MLPTVDRIVRLGRTEQFRPVDYIQNLSTCEPAAKKGGLCCCFVRPSHTAANAVARRPNRLDYSRDLIWVHFRSFEIFF